GQADDGFGHAIGTAQIAAVRDADAQVVVDAPEGVDELAVHDTFVGGEITSVLILAEQVPPKNGWDISFLPARSRCPRRKVVEPSLARLRTSLLPAPMPGKVTGKTSPTRQQGILCPSLRRRAGFPWSQQHARRLLRPQ